MKKVIRLSGFVQVSNKLPIVYIYIFNYLVWQYFNRVIITLLIFAEAHFCTLDRGNNGEFGFVRSRLQPGRINEIESGSSAEQQGLEKDYYIFSINKINVLGEGNESINELLKNSGSSVEVGALMRKKFGTNLCKSSYIHHADYKKNQF